MTYNMPIVETVGWFYDDRLNRVRQNENNMTGKGLYALTVSQTVSSVPNCPTTVSWADRSSPQQLQTVSLSGETE